MFIVLVDVEVGHQTDACLLWGITLNNQELVSDMEHYEKRLKNLGEQATKLLDQHGADLLNSQLELAVRCTRSVIRFTVFHKVPQIEEFSTGSTSFPATVVYVTPDQ